jgi:putative transposase
VKDLESENSKLNRIYAELALENAYVFASRNEVQGDQHDWLLTYNDYRPHEALGDVPPTRHPVSLARRGRLARARHRDYAVRRSPEGRP